MKQVISLLTPLGDGVCFVVMNTDNLCLPVEFNISVTESYCTLVNIYKKLSENKNISLIIKVISSELSSKARLQWLKDG